MWRKADEFWGLSYLWNAGLGPQGPHSGLGHGLIEAHSLPECRWQANHESKATFLRTNEAVCDFVVPNMLLATCHAWFLGISSERDRGLLQGLNVGVPTSTAVNSTAMNIIPGH